MMARYWRSMFTDFWMLAAERVPVRNVSRPRARGFCTSSSSRTEPSGLSSARSMRTPLDPMSMTEMTGVAPAAPTGTAPAIAGVVVVVSGMGLQHRFQGELLLEEIATLFSDGPLVQGDVPPRARLERELGILGLGRDPEHVLAVIVIQRVRQPQDCRQSAHLIAGALRERRVVLVAGIGRRLAMVAGHIGDHLDLLVVQSQDRSLRDDVVGVPVMPRTRNEIPHLVEESRNFEQEPLALSQPVHVLQLIEERECEGGDVPRVLGVGIVFLHDRV